jgi:hypothetical protein
VGVEEAVGGVVDDPHHHPVVGNVEDLLDREEVVVERARRRDPAGAEARRQRLREGSEVDRIGRVGAQRGRRLAVVAEGAVGVVLDEEDGALGGEVSEGLAPRGRHGHPGRVLEVGMA